MDIEQLRQWMEMAQKYQNGNFWDTIFDQYMGANHQNTGATYHNTGPTERSDQGDERESQTANVSAEFPLTDIFLTETEIIVIIELPGLRKEDIRLSLSGNILLIKGMSKIPVISGSSFLNERKYGAFERNIKLPEPADSKDIRAKFDNGLLFVTYERKYSQHEEITIL